MKCSFVVWNIGRKELYSSIENLVREYEPNVLVLIESELLSGKLLQILNSEENKFHCFGESLAKQIQIYFTYNSETVNKLDNQYDGAYSFLTLNLPYPMDINLLLAIVHLPNKKIWNEESINDEMVEFAIDLKNREKEFLNYHTIVMGDFNLNPFERGIVSKIGLNATMDRCEANKNRTIQKKEYKYFYNPMWKHYAPLTNGTQGTYYLYKSEPIQYLWNIFDQVIIGPTLLPYFNDEDLIIITSLDGVSLVDLNGRPNSNVFSDHLPIYFQFNFQEGVTDD